MTMPAQEPQYPVPMSHGEVTRAPEHDYVYPDGDPKFSPVKTDHPAADDATVRYDPDGAADFTRRKPRPTFRVGREKFEGKIEVPALAMMRFSLRQQMLAKVGDDITEESLSAMTDMIRLMLRKESADRFVAAMDGDSEDENATVIGINTFNQALEWLMGEYGMRPTEPLKDSSDGSPETPTT